MARLTRTPAREGLKKAAELVADAVRRKAPTAESAASFKVYRRLEAYYVGSHDIGTVETERNGRHPVFARGPRSSWTWTEQNKYHPERTHFMEQAAEQAVNDAMDKYADTTIRGWVVQSRVLREGR